MNYMSDTQLEHKPWYKQFWPWLLIFLPASAILGGIATILIATHNPDSVVVDDYYKEGLAINRDIAKDHKAVQLGIQATLHIDSTQQQIRLTLNARQNVKADEIRLRLLHPTLSRHDQNIMLLRTGTGKYQGFVRVPDKGEWNVVMEPADHSWRLARRIQLEPGKDAVLR